MLDSEQIKKQVQKENELRAAYARKFGGGDPDSLAIIQDLKEKCFDLEPAYTGKGSHPTEDLLHRDGMRAVLKHIETMARAKPINEEEFIKEMISNEE